MKYWIELRTQLNENKALDLWHRIEPAKANMMVMSSTHIYGEATEDCLRKILLECARTGADLQLNIG